MFIFLYIVIIQQKKKPYPMPKTSSYKTNYQKSLIMGVKNGQALYFDPSRKRWVGLKFSTRQIGVRGRSIH